MIETRSNEESGHVSVDDPVLGITLSQEELLFVLRLTGVPTLPGLNDDTIARQSADQLDTILVAGENGLRARGLLASDANAKTGAAVSELILAAVGTCVMSSTVAQVRIEPITGDGETRYYHVGEDLVVEHSTPQPGIHRFLAFENVLAAVRAIAKVTRLADSGTSNEDDRVFHVPEAVVRNARDEVVERKNASGALELLSNSGVPLDAARHFVQMMSGLEMVLTVTYLSRAGNEGRANGFVLLHCTDGNGIIQLSEFDDTHVTLEIASDRSALSFLSMALSGRL